MNESVGAIAWFYEGQRNSCVEMVKSFRNYNPNSSIVIISDGIVSNIADICKTYDCNLFLYTNKHGYPASKTVDTPKEYLRRFFLASFNIKEKYFINLEPDCLVVDQLNVDYGESSDIIGYFDPMWAYNFYGRSDVRDSAISEIFGYYKKCGIGDGGFPHGGKSLYFDRIVGGGGFLFKTDYAKFIINNWTEYNIHFDKIGQCLKHASESIPPFLIFQDYLLSVSMPIHNHKYKININYEKKIIHPCKKFYIN